MTTIDPSTGRPLGPEAIQRVLHIAAKVHVYQIPPLASNQGHKAASWTNKPPIFSPRLRILETAIPSNASDSNAVDNEKVSLAILLEDPSTGELFAAAPYNHPSVVAQAVDSSRFFAMRVVGEGGMKATLGVGFEERTDAFDFGVALQDASKDLGFPGQALGQSSGAASKKLAEAEKPKDYSLKAGETITVDIGARKNNSKEHGFDTQDQSGSGDSATAVPFLPPPPSAEDIRSGMRNSGDYSGAGTVKKAAPSAKELGFDDGEFGEFQ